jgi:hypothetical protein
LPIPWVLTSDSRRRCTGEHSPAVPAGQGAAWVDTEEVLRKKAAAKLATPVLRHRMRGLTHGRPGDPVRMRLGRNGNCT